ncbi:MAG: alpha/beta hydrolase family protein [Bacteroidaceae bacterium]
MKQHLIPLCLMLTFTGTIHAESIPVNIHGDHGNLSAIIQKPCEAAHKKIPLVIICHGFTADKEGVLLHRLADTLEAHGIASLRFDFNGHGQSEGRFEEMTVPNEIEDAKKVVAYAHSLPWTGQVIMAGHSQGGVVTAMTAAQMGKKSVAGRILLAPAAVLRDDALRGNTFGAQYNPQDPPQTIELWGGHKLGGNFIRTAVSLPIYETARNYKGAQLVIHGECDRIVPYTYGERFHQENKKSRFVLLENADHGFGGMENQVARLCSEFIEKICR